MQENVKSQYERESGGDEAENLKDEKVSRRDALKMTTGAAAAGAVLGGGIMSAIHALTSESDFEKKTAELVRIVRAAEESIKRGEGARILKEGTSFEVYQLLFDPASPLRRFGADVIKDTQLDPSSPKVYPYFPSVELCRVKKPTDDHPDFPELKSKIEVVARDNTQSSPTELPLGTEGMGNGIVLSPTKVITNAHVAEMFADLKAGIHDHPDGESDAALVTLPSGSEVPKEAVDATPRWEFMKEEDLHGTFVVAAGIDQDLSNTSKGLKYFGGFLIRANEQLLKNMGLDGRLRNFERMVGKHLFIGVPVGQTLPVNIPTSPFSSVNHIYASGLSGSPLLPLATVDGRSTIAGLVTAVTMYWSHPGAPMGKECCYELMFVVPAPTLKKLVESSEWQVL